MVVVGTQRMGRPCTSSTGSLAFLGGWPAAPDPAHQTLAASGLASVCMAAQSLVSRFVLGGSAA